MAEINSLHEAPVFLASRGHVRVGISHPHTGPIAGPSGGRVDTPAERRRRAKAMTKARKREVQSGAPFLRRLTTLGGAGVSEGRLGGERWRAPGAKGVGYP